MAERKQNNANLPRSSPSPSNRPSPANANSQQRSVLEPAYPTSTHASGLPHLAPSPASYASNAQNQTPRIRLPSSVLDGAKFIAGYASTIWGMKLVLLCTLTYSILSCYLAVDGDMMFCTGKLLLMRWISHCMHWGNIKLEAVILLFQYVTALRFNVLVVAVMSSALTLLLTITSVTSSIIWSVKLAFGFIRRITGF